MDPIPINNAGNNLLTPELSIQRLRSLICLLNCNKIELNKKMID